MLIAGIDPGLSGALAVYDTESGEITGMWDMPTLSIKRGKTLKLQINLPLLEDIISLAFPTTVWIEDVGGLPRQSAPAAFNFGKSVGQLEAFLFCYRVSLSRVAPATWKRSLGVNKDKESSRFRASQLMPGSAHWWTRKKDDGRAEAALLAYYGAQTVQEMRYAA